MSPPLSYRERPRKAGQVSDPPNAGATTRPSKKRETAQDEYGIPQSSRVPKDHTQGPARKHDSKIAHGDGDETHESDEGKKGKGKARDNKKNDKENEEEEGDRYSRAHRASEVASTTSTTIFLTEDVFQTLSSWAYDGEPANNLAANREVFAVPEYLFLLEAIKWQREGHPYLSQALSRIYFLVREFNILTGQDAQADFLRSLVAKDRRNQEDTTFQQLMGHVQQMAQSQHQRTQASDQMSTELYAVSAVTLSGGPSRQGQRNSFHTPSLHNAEQGNESLAVQHLSGLRLRDSRWFSLGRLFLMVWHTNATAGKGRVRQQRTAASHGQGEKVFSEIRRFAVVRECRGFCWAVPVSTYQGKGVGRHNFHQVDIEAHAIIHMADTKPTQLPSEPKMSKRPIAVEKTDPGQKLDAASRIRFDKVFTIEHNVKVKNCGKIARESMPIFRHYFKQEVEAATGRRSRSNSPAPEAGMV
ncbi:hypothetical protein A1O3_10499 [Capronia epimyces CBS 606.96]|uniref:DUF6590 domain-containing protein n=1 Tax=Capronia epimyces CBS 606.96 TaxID=1182542 RepID=W9Y335_9EURO|nr:uncharacterized protein A1O3_10499 [Capronia epimyces CBS 606.96]EXJ76854.1 hypothetical protein A1O3_10499 [Capronia epimyces CBS 606.96]